MPIALLAIAISIGTNWAQLTMGTAALLTLVWVVRTLRGMQNDVLNFFGNHMSKVTAALEKLVETNTGMSEKVDRLHDDNVETAKLLLAARPTRTRSTKNVTRAPQS